jgi:hypothetical protein
VIAPISGTSHTTRQAAQQHQQTNPDHRVLQPIRRFEGQRFLHLA